MFFVPCTVIQLCNVNQENALLKINVLIQFFLSSTCFQLMVNIRKTTLYMRPCRVCFSCICASRLAGWRMCSIVFLTVNVRCSKHVDEKRN